MWKKKKNKRNVVKSFESETERSTNVGTSGIGYAGKKATISFDVDQYEAILKSLRQAAEAISNFPIDNSILEKGGLFFNQLSSEGVDNLKFLNGYIENPVAYLESIHSKGTDATWIKDHMDILLSFYMKTIDDANIAWKKNIPIVKYWPLGMKVVLSEYQGAFVELMKKSNSVNYFTWDRPVRDNVKYNDRNVNFQDGACIRGRDETVDKLFTIIFWSSDKKYFSEETAKQRGVDFGKEDILYYRPD